VLDPAKTMQALDSGFPLYRHYFIYKWRRSLMKKMTHFPAVYDFSRLASFRSLMRMTDYFVLNHTEYPDLGTYLAGYALTGERLADLTVPSSVLLVEDDPVIPVADLPRLARTGSLEVDTTTHGGHCGLIQGVMSESWLDSYVARKLT
jgi:predicted alpha/beta-fold hydrolase